MMNRIRRIWRAIFAPEPPPRIDGPYVVASLALTKKPLIEIIRERGDQNRDRRLRWLEGKRI